LIGAICKLLLFDLYY